MTRKSERRDPDDRRQEEAGPPKGWLDRRRTTERRIPQLVEEEVSEAEWALYFGKLKFAANNAPDGSLQATLTRQNKQEALDSLPD